MAANFRENCRELFFAIAGWVARAAASEPLDTEQEPTPAG